jgi:transcription initiation factor TFIIB
MGKTPTTVAAVIILKVLTPTFSKKDISERCKVSIPTLNKNEIIVNKYLEGK